MSLFSELSNQESWGPLVSEGTVISRTVPLTLKIGFSTMCKIHPQNTPSGKLTLATHTWSTRGRTREESLQAICGSFSSSEEQVTAICVFSQKAPLPCFDANKPTDTLLIHRVMDGRSLGCGWHLRPSHVSRDGSERSQELPTMRHPFL